MFHYAHIQGGLVREVISLPEGSDLDSLYHETFVEECHPILYGLAVEPGWAWDGHSFSAPPPPPRITILPAQDFLARLTAGERAAMMATFASRPQVFTFLLTVMASATVDLSDASTAAGVHAAEAAGILTAERATEVLA